jgi:hypothetical protein
MFCIYCQLLIASQEKLAPGGGGDVLGVSGGGMLAAGVPGGGGTVFGVTGGGDGDSDGGGPGQQQVPPAAMAQRLNPPLSEMEVQTAIPRRVARGGVWPAGQAPAQSIQSLENRQRCFVFSSTHGHLQQKASLLSK